MKRVYLTEQQAELFAKTLEKIAGAVETGTVLEFGRRVGKVFKIPPEKALRNQAAWLRRTLDEQNGGYRLVTAWDFPEER